MARAQGQFSPELRAGIGGALYDGSPAASWEQFEAEALRALSVLDFPVSN